MKLFLATILLVLCITSYAANSTAATGSEGTTSGEKPPTSGPNVPSNPNTNSANMTAQPQIVIALATNQSSQNSQVANYYSMNNQGYCNVEYYAGAYLVRTLHVSQSQPLAWWGNWGSKYNDKINYIYYHGSRCFLWIVIYDKKYEKGDNLGFWTNSDSGYIDLNYYSFYDFSNHQWYYWGNRFSSTAVYYN